MRADLPITPTRTGRTQRVAPWRPGGEGFEFLLMSILISLPLILLLLLGVGASPAWALLIGGSPTGLTLAALLLVVHGKPPHYGRERLVAASRALLGRPVYAWNAEPASARSGQALAPSRTPRSGLVRLPESCSRFS